LKQYDGAYSKRVFQDWEVDLIFTDLAAKDGLEQLKQLYAKENPAAVKGSLTPGFLEK
jgi:hypothetical protein